MGIKTCSALQLPSSFVTLVPLLILNLIYKLLVSRHSGFNRDLLTVRKLNHIWAREGV